MAKIKKQKKTIKKSKAPKKKIRKKKVVKSKKKETKKKLKLPKLNLDFFKKILGASKEVKEKKEIPQLSGISKSIIVEDIMVRNPISVESKDSLLRAFELLEKYRLKSIIVTENGEPIGIIDEQSILSFFSSFVKMEIGSLEENKNKLDKLSKQPVSVAMTRIHQFVTKTTPLEEAIKIMNSYKLDQLPVVEKGKLIGSLLEENVLRFIEKQIAEQRITKSEVLQTGIDKLLDLVNAHKEISSKEAADILKVSISEIEKWARILQQHGSIDIDFSTVGMIKLRKKEKWI